MSHPLSVPDTIDCQMPARFLRPERFQLAGLSVSTESPVVIDDRDAVLGRHGIDYEVHLW